MNNPLVQVEPGLYIWTIVTFVVLLLLLAKFAWRPLLEALERRQEAIRKSLDEARQAKQELGRLHEESARILAAARAEADAIISRTRADAVRAGEELKQKARADAENIVKHAEATRVSILLTRKESSVAAVVEDDGKGFDKRETGDDVLGLVGMRERVGLVGGRLVIESAKGSGTTIAAEVPVP